MLSMLMSLNLLLLLVVCGDGKIGCNIVVGGRETAAWPEQAGATGLLLAKTLWIVGTIRTSFHRMILDIALAGLLAASADVQQLLGLVKLVDMVRSFTAVLFVPSNTDILFSQKNGRDTIDSGVRLPCTTPSILTGRSAETPLTAGLEGGELGEHLLGSGFVEKGLNPRPVSPLKALVLPTI